MNEVKEMVEELRNKKSRDNRDLFDRSANMIEKLAKELCEKSGCHHKCHDTKDCVVEEEAEELFKQALVEGVNRRINKTIGIEKQIEGEWIVDAWDGEEWVIVPYIKTQHTDAFCSVCYGCALYDDEGEEIASAFCPHCGAKMKGGN